MVLEKVSVSNITFFVYFLIETSTNTITDILCIKIVNKEIAKCQKNKLLGVTIDKNINMVEHLQPICKQASNKLHALVTQGEVIYYIPIQLLSYCLDVLPTEIY